MPLTKLLPIEISTISSESLIQKHSSHSNIIYNLFIAALLASFVALPFIAVDVSVKSSAFIRPTSEVSVIHSLVNGRVKQSFLHENQLVHKGDVLYTLESEVLLEKEKYLQSKTEDVIRFISDLNVLLSPSITNLKTPLYQQAYFNYKQKINEATTHYLKVKTDYDRNYKLHSEKVIADVEFENFKFELDKAQHEIELIKQSQLSQWQNEIQNYNKELQDFTSQLAQLSEEKKNLIITAPISGNVQNVAGIYAGSTISVNQDLAQISPNTDLIAEAFVSPNDIGLLQNDMPVRFQVDAFNYNQWGLASGHITDISNDVHMLNNKPVFKIKCSLDKDFLKLKNGYKGHLKKGMTLQARFIVTERTLWQLLYDKVDDWVNPNLAIGH